MSIVFKADLTNVLELFNGKSFSIPVFQRDYAWEKDQIREFWEDISICFNNPEEEHFLGSIILTKNDESSDYSQFEIIDGQQRVTTIQIFLSAIRDRWIQQGDPVKTDNGMEVKKSALTANLIHTVIPRVQFVLTPNRHLKGIFRDYVQKPFENGQLDINNNIALKQSVGFEHATDLIRAVKQIRGLVATLSDDELEKLERFLVYKVKILKVEAGGPANAFLLFETLNYRGLELAQSDLVKSYLYSKITKQKDQDRFINEWDDATASLGRISPDTFLRHVLTLAHGTIQKKHIFQKVKESYSESDAAIEFGELVGESARLYSLITRENQAKDPLSKNLNYSLDRLADLRVDTQSIFILAALRRLYVPMNEQLRLKLLDLLWTVEVLSFRWSTCGKNAQELENLYQEAAALLLNTSDVNEAVTIARRRLIEEIPNDVLFEENFRNAYIKTSARAHYILRSLEAPYLENGAFHLADPLDLHVEHVAPQRPSGSHWRNEMFGDLSYLECVYQIGNQILLPGKKNKDASNKPFSEKVEIYKKDISVRPLPNLSAEVLAKVKWQQSDVVERTQALTAKALIVWGIPSL